MATNVSRGAAAKGRTKKYLQAQGYQVADLEVVRYIFGKGGRMPVKRDQFGSDLLAVNEREVVFVQVKSGKSAAGGSFPDARREFAKHVFPHFATLLIVAWPPRARQPRLVLVLTDGSYCEYLPNPTKGSHGKESKG
ncbi:hypothetical protein UFOVP1601_17 [uncultured Caudovirales phage]|uniref:Uncharacterized protein n=1 Tax=uncultured Caudovirales phage TaxID=2100421 RepID=A0A6J5RR80_9CAUD|nr:hypothetical protein UFOVP1154_27 [uncultured Caudovirales phage]CAB4199870.1 hypothetical protein UFOVP1341_10 [uncultured Caudovirales phage]CAB4218415.1 hypothetical protein UFOVP1601_17 [uncultured Caudovirales phage]